jgi:hypothetical protein
MIKYVEEVRHNKIFPKNHEFFLTKLNHLNENNVIMVGVIVRKISPKIKKFPRQTGRARG